MSVNRAQTASVKDLSFEAALDALFDKILEQFRQSDLFSSSDQPVIFPVYAHDNPIVGTSHAWCVIRIIKWLEAAGCRAISDRNPLLPHPAQGDDSAATRNILSNQLCLLPRGAGQRQAVNERTHANKALVFCSEVLRQYCINASAREYVGIIEDVYKKCQGKPRDHFEQQLQLTVEKKAMNGNAWFHHVLTEIAFLKLRKNIDCRDHGIIPVALDGELPDYLPFFGPTDLVLKRESVSLYTSDLHKTFFKILLQTFPDQYLAIEKFKDCYMTLKIHWANNGGTVVRDSFDAPVVKHIRQAFKSILQQDQIATRHRLRDRASDHTVGQTQEEPDGDTAEILSRKREFLSTLPTVPYRDRKDRNPERDEGTCIWFKNHAKFQEWQERKGASLLWVSADPGCGKSVLSKYLVDDVLLTTDEQVTCYFFFTDDFEDQRTLDSALRCLLHQVFEHNLSLLDLELISRFESDGQLLHSRTDLWEIFSNVIRSRLTQGIVCILDGFDECHHDDRSFLMKNLQKLYMNEEAPPIKLLLTSRPYEDIARGLRKLHNKELIIHLEGESEQEMDKISQEIDLVIRKNVDDLGEDLDLEPDVTSLIKNELTKVENRTYLWVALMIDLLKSAIQTSKSAIHTLIQRLPRSVSAVYEKMLSREQNDETNTKTRRLLHIIMASNEPLTPGQIAVAFSMSEGTLFDEKSISRDTRFIRDFSRLLIVIRNDKTYLAHQTVREFLIMESIKPPDDALFGPFIRWGGSFHPQHSNRVLASSCMSYLEQCASGDHVFHSYARANWFQHLRVSGDLDESMVIQSRNLCDPSSERFLTWFHMYWQLEWDFSDPPTNLTGLIVASMVGLKETVELLLHTQQDLDAKDNANQMTAFSWACYGMHSGVAELLLDWVSKSSPNILDRIINTIDEWGTTPLHDVLYKIRDSNSDSNKEAGKQDILLLLLSSGANTNSQDTQGATPLHIAVECSEDVVKLLLQSGADPGLRDSGGVTAFHQAVKAKQLAVARLLLEHGAKPDIDSQDSDHSTPLLSAIESRFPDMTRLLLDYKADINLKLNVQESGSSLLRVKTPLLYAIDCNALDILELLLERGAKLDLASKEWKDVLIDAVRHRKRGTLRMLLRCGADLNFLHNGSTPLRVAYTYGDRKMVDFLLRHGADRDARVPEEKLDWKDVRGPNEEDELSQIFSTFEEDYESFKGWFDTYCREE